MVSKSGYYVMMDVAWLWLSFRKNAMFAIAVTYLILIVPQLPTSHTLGYFTLPKLMLTIPFGVSSDVNPNLHWPNRGEDLLVSKSNANLEGFFKCTEPEEEVKCFETDLQNVTNGDLQCPSGPIVLEGDACGLTCEDGFYSFQSNRAVCKAEDGKDEGQWAGNLSCRHFDCENWNERRGKGYKYIHKYRVWETSRQSCENENGHLVSINNKEENDFLHNLLIHCNAFSGSWIGMNDIAKEGEWKWSNQLVLNYNNWDEPDPNGGISENCAIMKLDNGRWNDFPCHFVFPAVCERNVTL